MNRDLFRPSVSPREAAFRRFHRDNPHVYAELVRRARAAKQAGATKLGMRMLFEVLRWDVLLRTIRLEGEPKLNDHHAPFYARLIQHQEPDLRGLFDLRGSMAAFEHSAEAAGGAA